jgi:hypothetical protein
MNRRELLKTIAVLTGGSVIGAELFLSGCKNPGATLVFTANDLALLNEVGETIIPTTDSPGAKAAQVAEFMQKIVRDCYTPEQQNAFTKGIVSLNESCKKANGKSYMDCTPQQRNDFLVGLEKEAKDYNKKVEEEEKVLFEKNKKENEKKSWSEQVNIDGLPRHYYTMIKQLTLWGYFTSEVGMTKALRYQPVPGKYDGDYPYKKGEKAFA